MKHFILTLIAALTLPVMAHAETYAVDYAKSSIQFSGTHAGNVFKGTFSEWVAEIDFDPAALESSSISASFKPASAKTGNAMYDGTLPQDDWFAVKQYPTATFTSTSISANTDGTYVAKGDLTIRGISKPVDFVFTLSALDKAPVIAKGSFTIDRLAYELGKKSDATAEWVSKEISIELNIEANKSAK